MRQGQLLPFTWPHALHKCYLIAGKRRTGEELGPRGKDSPKREWQRYKPRANFDPAGNGPDRFLIGVDLTLQLFEFLVFFGKARRALRQGRNARRDIGRSSASRASSSRRFRPSQSATSGIARAFPTTGSARAVPAILAARRGLRLHRCSWPRTGSSFGPSPARNRRTRRPRP